METDYAPVELTQKFNVPTEDVFDAWTDPSIIRKWLFKSDDNEIVEVFNDLKQNGSFSIVEKTADGKLIDHFGTYHEIVRPNLISFSLEVPEHFPGVSSVVIRIHPSGEGSELSFLQTGVDPELVEGAWKKMFERLKGAL